MKYVQLAVLLGSMSGLSHAMNNHEAVMNNNAMDPNMAAMMQRAYVMEKALEQTKVPIIKAVNEHMKKWEVESPVKYAPEFQKLEQEYREKIELLAQRLQGEFIEGITLISQRLQNELMEQITNQVPELKELFFSGCAVLASDLKKGNIRGSEELGLVQECAECMYAFNLLTKFAQYKNDENLLSKLDQFEQLHDTSLFTAVLDKQR